MTCDNYIYIKIHMSHLSTRFKQYKMNNFIALFVYLESKHNFFKNPS
jgi:hypothetical protein